MLFVEYWKVHDQLAATQSHFQVVICGKALGSEHGVPVLTTMHAGAAHSPDGRSAGGA